VAQTATKLVIEPIYEADLEDSAHGYRPGKSAVGAVKEVHEALCQGYTDVVDADLSKYFDTIPHRELLQTVAKRIVDKHLLHLIKMWLKVPVEEQDEQGRPRMSGGRKSKTGTPQGGVISPLLANIYINRMLRAWRERGLDQKFQGKIVAYADDFVVLSRGKAQEAMQWIAWAVNNLGLALNEGKTTIRDATQEKFEFLGYSFGPTRHRKDGHWYLGAQPSKTSQARLKAKLREVLHPGNVAPLEEVVTRVNRTLRGWSNYFCHGTRTIAYRAIDHFVYERVRGFLCRRHKVSGRGTRRFSDSVVFEEYGFLRLRAVQLGPRAWAS
jgi:RNA-directed DNA polymerase